MRKGIYNIDDGVNFGIWQDDVSKLMYYDSTKTILSTLNLSGRIADFGGGNGLLKQLYNNVITIDIDESKQPDIKDDILTHKGEYDIIFIRYVLHYLNDYEVIKLFENIKSFHKGKVIIQQFVNEDLKTKYHNSINEFKYFRTESQLLALLPKCQKIYSIAYKVTKDFYRNRLKIENAKEHNEIINAYLINF